MIMKRTLSVFLMVLLPILAGLQTAQAQGFRVYNSDGTVLQFSLRTDSIVFYDSIGSEQDFGLFTPVNQMIVGTWYKSKSESITFTEDGKTNIKGGPWFYEFFPFQGNLLLYSSDNSKQQFLHVFKLTKDTMVIVGHKTNDYDNHYNGVYTRTQPEQLVGEIVLSETYLFLQPDESKRLSATVDPSDADNPAVTWESSNDGVAEVNSTGRVTANANGTCTITCRATDGSGVKAECMVRVGTYDNSGTINGRDYVDLGLPSGTLWATCNVGANSPEKYGGYYAWGETTTKSNYSWSTYKYCKGSEKTITKYCTQSWYGYNGYTDNLTELLPEDDAATANWGSSWQMPSLDQLKELINSNYTTTTWTTLNGVYGRKITSKSNGKSVFLPAAGSRYDTSLDSAGCYGLYWSRSLDTSDSYYAYCLCFYSGNIYADGGDYRYIGRSVRPVRVP